MREDFVTRLVRRIARTLPAETLTRVFEPAFEDLRAARPSRVRLFAGGLWMMVDCCRLALTHPGPPRRRRDAGRTRLLETLTQDCRYAARMLCKNPGFTGVAVVVLALGIGANAAIFSLLYGLFVRPLPYPDAARLVRFYGQSPDGRLARLGASVPKFQHIRDHQRSSREIAADAGIAMALTSAGADPQRVTVGIVTANYFDVLGVRAFEGRTFSRDEEERAQVAVVTRSFWRSRLNGDASALGRSIALDGRAYTIVGVVNDLPVSDVGPTEAFVPLPFQLSGLSPELMQRGVSYLRITGRLKDDVTLEQAREDAKLLGESYREQNREKADSSWHEIAIPIREDLTGNVRPAMMTLLAAVALVLLIACSNVANLLTARFAGRRREIAVRAALGAERTRIVRLFLVESVMLSIAGAAAGIAIAAASLELLPGLVSNLPLDGRATVLEQPVLWATIAVAVLTGLLMGVYPALQAAKPAPAEVLRSAHGASGGQIQHRVRSTLVAGQVSLSLMLVVGAALLVNSFSRLRSQEPGFDPGAVLTANLALPPARYPTQASQDAFRERLLERLREIPGVRQAALAVGLPLTGNNSTAPFARGDGRVPPLNERPLGLTRSITPGYFATLSIPVLNGRDFDARDGADAPPVIIISQQTARTLFPDVDAVGRTVVISSTGGGIRCEVVGVVADVRSVSLAKPNDVEFYRPFTQRGNPFGQIAIRTVGDPSRLVADLRFAVRAVDPELPLNQLTTLASVTDASLGQRKLQMVLLAAFAALAVLLSTMGIYSVVAYVVGQRTSEIGIRLALGAHRADVLRLMTWEGIRPVGAGLAAGLAGVIALGRMLASQLYGVTAFDPVTLMAAMTILGAVALAACIIPARRAARVDPAIALRGD
jgi:putative ABC transport system permease protein